MTRPREQAAELVDRLTALGAESIEAPMIRMAPPDDPDPLLRAAANPDAFDWIVFTSANAVDAFMTALLDGERDVRALKGPRICASGTGDGRASWRAYGIKVDLIPREFRADAVVAALLEHRVDGGRPRAAAARRHRPRGHRRAAARGGRDRHRGRRLPHGARRRASAKAIRTSTGCCSTAASTW